MKKGKILLSCILMSIAAISCTTGDISGKREYMHKRHPKHEKSEEKGRHKKHDDRMNMKEVMTGMPNPASKFCVDKGGESIIKKDNNGNEYGICRFKDGHEVEEWQYFRENKK